MLITSNTVTSDERLIYMERYVNRGSPSGFSEVHSPSRATSPTEGSGPFHVLTVSSSTSRSLTEYGVAPPHLNGTALLIHPDMGEQLQHLDPGASIGIGPLVQPTSSGRTVKIVGPDGWYIKLAYNGLLGRTQRVIDQARARCAVEITEIVERTSSAGRLPSGLFILREPYAQVTEIEGLRGAVEQWGYVLRDPKPYPMQEPPSTVIPGFALFSTDLRRPEDPTILQQIIDANSNDSSAFLLDAILAPIIDGYFGMLLSCGLQLEAHAQNILIAFSDRWETLGIVARDAESIDRDLDLMSYLNLGDAANDTGYKCLTRGQYNYDIMHSFMFDFKLCEYLIRPLLEEAQASCGIPVEPIIDRLKERVRGYTEQLPGDFFPKGKWYSYENRIHDPNRPRPYLANPDPLLR